MFDPETTFPLTCSCCGINLTRAEEEEPFTIRIPIEGTKFFSERIVCDKCKSDHQALDWAAYNAVSSTYPFRSVKHI